ncbi:unnamed protein product [Amoebophrya sp. A120]|nr:unnamed protein product [Amoebophrya sp. A120]|eukprot:GSA120T00016789001.1
MSLSSNKRSREEALLEDEDVGDEEDVLAGGIPEDLPDEIDEEEILRMLAQADEVEVEQLTAQTLKKTILTLERKLKVNQELRIKHAEDPAAFADSEIELNEQILKLRELSTAPELYATFLELKGLQLLLKCMAHVNTDIGLCVLDVLNALTETDNFSAPLAANNEPPKNLQNGGSSSSSKPQETATDSLEVGEKFVDALVKANVGEMVVEMLFRVDEAQSEEDAKGITDAFGFIENLVEIKPDAIAVFAKIKKFHTWLLKRLRSEKVDQNKAYASEILAIVLQNNTDALDNFGDGVEKLLKGIAVYRKRDLEDNVEIEYAENMFDCLCQLLLQAKHQQAFCDAQGAELMVRIMNRGSYAAKLAVKLCDMACRGHKQNCDLFVEKLGLKPLFAFFMRKGLKKKDFAESEEYILGLIHSISRWCSGNCQARLMNKFTENGFEKLQRLFEIHVEFSQRLKLADDQRQEGRLLIAEEMELDAEDIYLERCDDGLATLQQADLIIVRLANMGNRQLAEAVQSLFGIKGVPKEEFRETVEEYCSHLDEELGAKEKKEVLRYLKEVVPVTKQAGTANNA